jgi:hypothetical protein
MTSPNSHGACHQSTFYQQVLSMIEEEEGTRLPGRRRIEVSRFGCIHSIRFCLFHHHYTYHHYTHHHYTQARARSLKDGVDVPIALYEECLAMAGGSVVEEDA